MNIFKLFEKKTGCQIVIKTIISLERLLVSKFNSLIETEKKIEVRVMKFIIPKCKTREFLLKKGLYV
jgi:hypothetical protein